MPAQGHETFKRLLEGLPPSERAVIERIDTAKLAVERQGMLEELASAMTRPAYGVGGCIRVWSQCVEELERGYRSMVYEYMNEQAARETLEEHLAQMPQELQAKIRSIIDNLDARFKVVTIENPVESAKRNYNKERRIAGDGWWWERWPLELPAGW